MLNSNQKEGLVLVVDKQGIILEIIYQELKPLTPPQIGINFLDIIDQGSYHKGVNMLTAIAEKGASFDWNLNLFLPQSIERVFFSGTKIESNILLVGFKSKKDAVLVYEGLLDMVNEMSLDLRKSIKKALQLEYEHQKIEGQDEMEEITRLNNELVTLQRELAKKNAETKRLYRELTEQLESARSLHQRSLSTDMFFSPPISIAAFYQAAQSLGGDFYDIIETSEHIIFYLTDVSGHGLDAAMITVFIKQTISCYLKMTLKGVEELTPQNIINFLNQEFKAANYPLDYFIAIFAGVIDKKNQQLHYASAGFQNLPFYQGPQNEIIQLQGGDLPVSNAIFKPVLPLKEHKLVLEKGGLLLAYTDGLVDEQKAGEDFTKRLQDILCKDHIYPPDFLRRVIAKSLFEFWGKKPLTDDITFLIIKNDDYIMQEKLTLNTDFSEIEYWKKFLIKQSTQHQLPLEQILMAGSELINNAVEHGNKLNKDKKIVVEFKLHQNFLLLSVKDQGPGFDWSKHISSGIDYSCEKGRGLGLSMIAACAHQFYFTDQGRRGVIIFKR